MNFIMTKKLETSSNRIRKKDWKKYHPPLVPVYFIDYKILKMALEEKGREFISNDGLVLMLSYFEDFEEYEKAALVRDELIKREIFE